MRQGPASRERDEQGRDQGRRTIRVTGHVPPHLAQATRGPRPDRVAAWAVVMGLLLAGLAAATADASPRSEHAGRIVILEVVDRGL